MPHDIGAAYDQVPYEGTAYDLSHPDALAVAACLAGLEPVRLDACRVLEVGCATGNNLLPIAAAYPNSQFVGIDASGVHIKMAEAQRIAHGLHNTQFHHLRLEDLPHSFGKFDYILAHGVWVTLPPAIQDRLLQVSHDFLSPSGLAYISYNTLPGWHWQAVLRDMMRLRASYFSGPAEKVKAGREFLAMIVGSLDEADTSPYAVYLREENERLSHKSDSLVTHEYLAELNQPIYFTQFIDRAQKAGLRFVSESPPSATTLTRLPKPIRHGLHVIANDFIAREQHLDFVARPSFRRTILCRSDCKPKLNSKEAILRQLSVACLATAEKSVIDFRSPEPLKFSFPKLGEVTVTEPTLKAAIIHLSQIYPRSNSFGDLLHAVSQQLAKLGRDARTFENDGGIYDFFVDGYLHLAVELHFQPAPVASEVSPKPVGWAFARSQAETSSQIVSTRHQVCNLSPFDRVLFRLLDGTRDREALKHEVLAMIERGVLALRAADSKVILDRETRLAALTVSIETSLKLYSRAGLLVG